MLKNQIQKLKKEYDSGLSLNELSKKYGWSISHIHKEFKKNNISCRSLSISHIKKKCNYNFFENIDTEAKAYFLGFLYADGAMTHNSMKLTLHSKDLHILQTFKKEIESEHQFINDRGYIRIQIGNLKLYQDLLDKGCGLRKSLTLTFPTEIQVPNYLIRHFIRGYFDGDGCITYGINKKYKHLNWKFSIIATYPFNTKLQAILGKEIYSSFQNVKLYREKDNDKLCYLTVGSSSDHLIEKIYNYLYKDSEFFLIRKKNKFEEILKIIKDTKTRKKLAKDTLFTQRYSILYNNRDKKLDEVAKLIGYNHGYDVGALYRQYKIERTFNRYGK